MVSDKKGISPLATGVVGAVIGAAAAAAAVALSDEKNRKKAEKILTDMQKEGNKIFKQITKMAMELKDRGEEVFTTKKAQGKLTVKEKESAD